jgi:hypothetical protein
MHLVLCLGGTRTENRSHLMATLSFYRPLNPLPHVWEKFLGVINLFWAPKPTLVYLHYMVVVPLIYGIPYP